MERTRRVELTRSLLALARLVSLGVLSSIGPGCASGCQSGTQDDSATSGGTDSADSADSAVPLVFEVSAIVSEVIPTVVTVTWTTTLPIDEPVVEFGQDEDYGRQAPAVDQGNGSFSALLLGLKPSQTLHLRACGQHQGQVVCSDDHQETTGPVPPELPGLLVPATEATQLSGGFLVTSLVSKPPTAVILDRDGDYVWWYQSGEDSYQMTRAQLSRDGQWMLFRVDMSNGISWTQSRVRLDGSEEEQHLIEDLHHDFVELPDGTLTLIRGDQQQVGEELVLGDKLTELGSDGSLNDFWSLWDHLEYDPEVVAEPAWDWSHANALDHDEQENVYYVAFRKLSTLLKIDGDSGEVLWQFGGLESDFELTSGEWPVTQHQFQIDGDRLLLFDNGADRTEPARVAEYQLDEQNWLAEETWSYAPEPPLICLALGDVSRLPNENVLITWSGQGQIDEITPQGELLWRLRTERSAFFGYTSWVESLYPSD